MTFFPGAVRYTVVMQVIYLDEVFLVDLAADYLLLLSAAWVCAEPARRWRLALGAALGAGYACAAAIPDWGFAASPWLRGAVGVAMALVAFGGSRRLLRVTLAFFCAGALYSGAVLALRELAPGGGRATLPLLLGGFALAWGVLALCFRRTAAGTGGGIADAEIVLDGRTVKLRALLDTGNRLADPLTGRRVLIADREAILSLFGPPEREVLARFSGDGPGLLSALDRAGTGGRFRLVPCRTVTGERTLLPAFSPDRVAVSGRRQDYLVAVAAEPVSDGGAYSAVAPAE